MDATARAIQGGINMSMISEQIQALRDLSAVYIGNGLPKVFAEAADTIEELSAKLATERHKVKSLIEVIDETCKYQRERNGDDSICGLCEYDGATIGENGDWMNECPGFETDSCFKLRQSFIDKYIEPYKGVE